MVASIGTDSDALLSFQLSVSSFGGAVTGLTANGRVRAIQEPFTGDQYWDFITQSWITDRNDPGVVRLLSEYASGFYSSPDKVDVDTARAALASVTGFIVEYEYTGSVDGVTTDVYIIDKTATEGAITYNYQPTSGSSCSCGKSTGSNSFFFDASARPIIYCLLNSDGTPVDLSELTLPTTPPDERIKVIYTPPGGADPITVIGELATPPDGRGDGLDGKIRVSPPSPFFTTAGIWRVRAQIEFVASTRTVPLGCHRVTTPESV